MDNLIFCDTETFCETNLFKAGTYKYAEDAEILLFTYAQGDNPVEVWDVTKNPAPPQDLQDFLLNEKYTLVFHNSNFDRNIIEKFMKIKIDTKRIIDTMVLAFSHGLPGALAKLGDAFNLPQEEVKNKEGAKLMRFFSKPLGKNRKLSRATSKTHPKEWQNFIEYAKQDVEAMRILYKKLPKINNSEIEQELWQLDQKINDRGFKIDLDLVEKAVTVIEEIQTDLARETSLLTGGAVKSATQRDKTLEFLLKKYGVSLPDLTRPTIERRLADESLPSEVKKILQIRMETSARSVSKFSKILIAVNSDDRLRGTLQFCGATRTGRWAGRIFQPQNLPRGILKDNEIEQVISSLKQDEFKAITDKPIRDISSIIRGCIVPSSGNIFLISDLSSIESRVASWVANEKWKIQAFKDFDAGKGEDTYKLAYAQSFNIDVNKVTKKQRAIGKVQELALGYGGGVGALSKMAEGYGIDLSEMTKSLQGSFNFRVIGSSKFYYGLCLQKEKTFGMKEEVFIACNNLKIMWRLAHLKIVEFWQKLENAAIEVILDKSSEVTINNLKIIKTGSWLYIKLPSGRFLCYPDPEVSEDGKISYLSMSIINKKWERIYTYGGKLFENVCQAIARDIMAYNMLKIDKYKGYEIVLTVHDEVIVEFLGGAFAGEKLLEKYIFNLQNMLAAPFKWTEGLPLAAGGFAAKRYKK